MVRAKVLIITSDSWDTQSDAQRLLTDWIDAAMTEAARYQPALLARLADFRSPPCRPE